MKVAVAILVSVDHASSGTKQFLDGDDEKSSLEEAMLEAREAWVDNDGDPRQELTFVVDFNEPTYSPIRLEVCQGGVRLVSATQ